MPKTKDQQLKTSPQFIQSFLQYMQLFNQHFIAFSDNKINVLCYLKIQMIDHTAIEFLKNRVLDEKFLISPCGRTSFGSVPGEWPRQTK
jgi:hypothetical protein